MARRKKKESFEERYLRMVKEQPRGDVVKRIEENFGAIRRVTITYESGVKEISEYVGNIKIK